MSTNKLANLSKIHYNNRWYEQPFSIGSWWYKFRSSLIKLVVGDMPVMMNLTVDVKKIVGCKHVMDVSADGLLLCDCDMNIPYPYTMYLSNRIKHV